MQSQNIERFFTEQKLIVFLLIWTPILFLQTLVTQNWDSEGIIYHLFTNDAPTISIISPQIIKQNTTTRPIKFTIEDVDNSANSLTVSATSSNPKLLSDENIFLDGITYDRSMTIKPTTGEYGNTIITLTVSDGKAEAEENFEIIVSQDNTPVISTIRNQTIKQGSSVEIAFTIGDLDTPPDFLKVTATSSNKYLIPNSNIYFYGRDTSRKMAIKPNPEAYGTAIITLSGQKNLNNDFTSFRAL